MALPDAALQKIGTTPDGRFAAADNTNA